MSVTSTVRVWPSQVYEVDRAQGESIEFEIEVKDRQPGEEGQFNYGHANGIVWDHTNFPPVRDKYTINWPANNGELNLPDTHYEFLVFFVYAVHYTVKIKRISNTRPVLIADFDCQATRATDSFIVAFEFDVK